MIDADLAREFNAEHPDGLLFEGPDAIGTWQTMTFTWRLHRGHYVFEHQRDALEPFRVSGIYQVSGNQMLIKLHPEIGNVVNRVTWQVDPDGWLELNQVDDLKFDYLYWLPWTRLE